MIGDIENNHYFVGNLRRDAFFNEIILKANPDGKPDIYIVKQNADGKFLWAARGGNPLEDDHVHAAATDSNGDLYIAGRFINSAVLGSVSIVGYGETDGLVAKIDGKSGEFVWARAIGGPGRDSCSAIAVDSENNVVVSGNREHVRPSFGSKSGYVTKFDKNGESIWTQSVSGETLISFACLTVDASGTITVGGRFQGTADFPSGAIASFSSPSVQLDRQVFDGFISRLDGNGNWLWARPLSSDDSIEVTSIISGNNETVYFAGVFTGTANLDEITLSGSEVRRTFVSQLNTKTQNIRWAQNLHPPQGSNPVAGMVLDLDGNLNIVGDFAKTVAFGHQKLTSDTVNAFWSKLSVSGEFLDTQRITAGTSAFSSGIHFDSKGNVYIAGSVFGGRLQLPQGSFLPGLGGGYIFKLPAHQKEVRLGSAQSP